LVLGGDRLKRFVSEQEEKECKVKIIGETREAVGKIPFEMNLKGGAKMNGEGAQKRQTPHQGERGEQGGRLKEKMKSRALNEASQGFQRGAPGGKGATGGRKGRS